MFRLLPLTIAALAVAVRGQDDPQFEHISIGPRSDPLSIIPAFVNIDQGWFVTLQFGPGKHSIRQSTFEDPCTFGGGFWSWNYTTSDPDSFVILDVWQNNNEKHAFYFFDAESDSCEQGMVFAINPPSEDAFNEFRDRAINGDVARSSTVASFAPITTVPEPSSTRAASSSVPSTSSQIARTTASLSSTGSIVSRSTTGTSSSATSSSSTSPNGDDDSGATYPVAGKAVIIATTMSLLASWAIL